VSSFEEALPTILAHEGGFVDHPDDPGGATNWGISLRFLKSAGEMTYDLDQDGDLTPKDIRLLTVQDAADLYRRHFWDPLHLDEVSTQDVATKILDIAVNMGHTRAVDILQQALVLLGYDLEQDAIMGPQTIGMTNQAEPTWLLTEMRHLCASRYRWLVHQRPQNSVFLNGWLRRAYS